MSGEQNVGVIEARYEAASLIFETAKFPLPL